MNTLIDPWSSSFLTLVRSILLPGRRLRDVRGDPQPEPARARHGQHHHVRPGQEEEEVQSEERLHVVDDRLISPSIANAITPPPPPSAGYIYPTF